MSDCWRKANPGLSWDKPCPQCGTYVRIYGDGAAERQNLDGWLRNCPTPREQLNSIRACFGMPPLNKAGPSAFEPTDVQTAGAAAGCRISRAPNNDCGGGEGADPLTRGDSGQLQIFGCQPPSEPVISSVPPLGGNAREASREIKPLAGVASGPQSPIVSSGVDGDTRATRLAESVERDPQAPATDKPLRYESSPRHSRFDSGLLTPIPPHGFAAPEAVTPRAWAVSDTDDFGLLRSLPLVIPASLVLWAVIAAASIALK